MKKLLLPFLSLFVCLNLYASAPESTAVSSNKEFLAYRDSLSLKTEEELYEQIRELQERIDELESVGSISAVTASAASAVLSSIVYGLAYTWLPVLFTDNKLAQNEILVGILASLVPNIPVALLMPLNSAPNLSFGSTLFTSLKSSIKAATLWAVGSGTSMFYLNYAGEYNPFKDFFGNVRKNTSKDGADTFGADGMHLLGIALIPYNTWKLYTDIITRRHELEHDVFTLKDQLDEAMIELQKKKAAKEAREIMSKERSKTFRG